jgi:hypothetical protein
MDVLESVAIACSPFPLVQLDNPSVPLPGQHYATPRFCQRAFPKGECEKFYRWLSANGGGRHQCPFGFSVWPATIGKTRLAVTGLVGWPRIGGAEERLRAKESPQNHVEAGAIPEWVKSISDMVTRGDLEREQEFARRLEALHEIRRFNQIVKTNMERACTSASPEDPDAAQVELVRTHRASSLISVQLDALDLLANPASAMSFEPRRWVFYKTVDKMVRIYQVVADSREVFLSLGGGSNAEVHMDKRTIHIIPSVFN